ncbi:MAG: Mov34/MPN/PAD-1 family protein [Ktedonobacteraceae bacterium]|nr:Mov34/MPN/PAD-1 family protein [Ktedonobacteraceae bacterium]
MEKHEENKAVAREGIASEAYVNISKAAWLTLCEDAYQRRHMEACGALLGRRDDQGNWHITRAHPLRNIASSPVYFEFDPQELLELELRYPGEMVGVYHSHPGGYARASSTDRENMQRVNVEQCIPWVWLIAVGPFECPVTSTVMLKAYHHYEDRGLVLVRVHLAEEAELQP